MKTNRYYSKLICQIRKMEVVECYERKLVCLCSDASRIWENAPDGPMVLENWAQVQMMGPLIPLVANPCCARNVGGGQMPAPRISSGRGDPSKVIADPFQVECRSIPPPRINVNPPQICKVIPTSLSK